MLLHPLPPQPELNIPALERSLELSSLTNSYKLYWFAALLEEINSCSAEITFRRIITLMIAKCWYSVLKFRLNFGALDMLHRLVHYLHGKYSIPAEISEADLKDILLKLDDPEFEKSIKEFAKYVPYRFLSPFYESELRGKTDHLKNGIIESLSRKDHRAIYRIRTSESKIEINYNWFEYLYCNMAIITGWQRYRLVEFLQRRNPNTPSVIDKIEPPQKRNLAEAAKFWRSVMQVVDVVDIYTGLPVDKTDMSLDHFIPWSFVLHDRLWNLAPVSKSVNSSKSDLLPPLETYLGSFIDLQYIAFTTAVKNGYSSRALEDYYMLNEGNFIPSSLPPMGVWGPGMPGLMSGLVPEKEFKEIMRNTIIPLHRIAQNQGFGVWSRTDG